jgi:hypothetical protein
MTQVEKAQYDMEQLMTKKINEVIQEIEANLHDGTYNTLKNN